MEDKEKGHDNLMADLAMLVQEAGLREFHDFDNTAYATPKVALVQKLEAIINNVKIGKYDN